MGWAEDWLSKAELERKAPHPGFNCVAGNETRQRPALAAPVEPCFRCGVIGKNHATSEFACKRWVPAK